MGIQTGEISSRKPGEYVRENYGREQYKKSSIKWAAGAEHISHRFGEKRVLQEVNFQVEEGETFGLLGPSGAGKTTLIRILTGQLKQTSGNVYLLETDTRRLSATQRRQVGIMMDCFGLYDRLSAYRNMAFYADIYRVPKSRIREILEQTGLWEARNCAVSRLSKGMKNRLSLARALMTDARILFLDEPTSGLDPATAKEIHGILEEQHKKGKTIFLTTHNMYEAEQLCDRVILLSNGSIVEEGSPEGICRRYNHLNRLRITLRDGRQIVLDNGKASAMAVKEYLEEDRIAVIHSTEPNLESVFIELTGKGLE